jgi:hypothetical protein
MGFDTVRLACEFGRSRKYSQEPTRITSRLIGRIAAKAKHGSRRTDSASVCTSGSYHVGARMAEINSALLLARIFCDAVVECLNFRIESFQRSLTFDPVLARRRIFASRHCLDELFDVAAANLVASRMAGPILLRTRHAIVRGISFRTMGALRRTDRSCRGHQQEDSRERQYNLGQNCARFCQSSAIDQSKHTAPSSIDARRATVFSGAKGRPQQA